MRAERRQCHHRPLLPQRVVHPPLSTARADVLCSPAAIADPRVFTRRLCFTQSWFSGQRSAPRGARNMDRLKSVLAAKKKETTEKFGEKKFLKRAELEAQKAKRPREQGGAQENVEEVGFSPARLVACLVLRLWHGWPYDGPGPDSTACRSQVRSPGPRMPTLPRPAGGARTRRQRWGLRSPDVARMTSLRTQAIP